MGQNEIQTERLILETLKTTHAELLFAGLNDSRLYQFIDDKLPESIASLQSRYERLIEGRSPDGKEIWLNWAIIVKDQHKYVGFVQATIQTDRSTEIAFVLFRDDWGHGYAREAVNVMMNHICETYDAEVFKARVDPRNDRSVALLKSLGFSLTRHAVGSTTIRGQCVDEAEYVIQIT